MMRWYVYILRSLSNPNQFYIGYTENLKRRFLEHIHCDAPSYTRRYRPWKIETYIVFSNECLARKFETYLKNHSGRAFLRKRFLSHPQEFLRTTDVLVGE